MRPRLLVASLLALIALAAPAGASASRYHLSLGLAKHETRELVKGACERIGQCTGYGVGRCYRNTDSNVSCIGGFFFGEPPEEEVCSRLIRWGVNTQGYVAFRGYGPQHCSLA
jgi:hypothetical protein